MERGFFDKIYIIGFSRGAIIARLVAGLISKFGVLKPTCVQYFPQMWDYIKGILVKENTIKACCHQDVPIEFLGLFDSVPGKLERREADVVSKSFQDRTLPRKVKTAVHILAMHESRLEYRPIVFKAVENAEQCLEQMWMPGVHSDIGGGYMQDFLGNISLITMLDRLKQKTALKFDDARLSKLREKIQDDFDNGKVAINNELGRWWHWPVSRIYGKYGWVQRKPSGADECQFYHPVCHALWLEGRFVKMKSAPKHKTFTMEEFTGEKGKGWPPLDPSRVPLLENIKP